MKGKCDAILASAPAAKGGGGVGRGGRPQTLYSNDVPRTKLASQLPSSAGVAFCVAGVALVGISMITVVRRTRGGQQIEDDVLAAMPKPTPSASQIAPIATRRRVQTPGQLLDR